LSTPVLLQHFNENFFLTKTIALTFLQYHCTVLDQKFVFSAKTILIQFCYLGIMKIVFTNRIVCCCRQLALPIANCGLRLYNEAVRVAVGVRLGLALCAPHSCPCGGQVDAQGLHAMVCKKAQGRIARHQGLNDIIWRSLGSASIPATKEPSGLVRQDGKWPDGLTLIPWQGGKSLAWDVTVVSMLFHSRMLTGQLLVWEWWQSWQLNKS